MSREAHVWFWEGVGVQLLCATRLVVIGERDPVEVRGLLQRDPDPLVVGQGRTRATECAAAEPGQSGGGAPRGGFITNTAGERREPIGRISRRHSRARRARSTTAPSYSPGEVNGYRLRIAGAMTIRGSSSPAGRPAVP